jgi:hypothetical protein
VFRRLSQRTAQSVVDPETWAVRKEERVLGVVARLLYWLRRFGVRYALCLRWPASTINAATPLDSVGMFLVQLARTFGATAASSSLPSELGSLSVPRLHPLRLHPTKRFIG